MTDRILGISLLACAVVAAPVAAVLSVGRAAVPRAMRRRVYGEGGASVPGAGFAYGAPRTGPLGLVPVAMAMLRKQG